MEEPDELVLDEDVPEAVADVVTTVGVDEPAPEEVPADAAKAFPEARSPRRTVAIPAFPITIEMDLLDSAFIAFTPCLSVTLDQEESEHMRTGYHEKWP